MVGRIRITAVYKGLWKVSKKEKLDVAMKVLTEENYDKYLKVMIKYMSIHPIFYFLFQISTL